MLFPTILYYFHQSLKKLVLIDQCSALQMIAMNTIVILLNQHSNTGDFYKKFETRRKQANT